MTKQQHLRCEEQIDHDELHINDRSPFRMGYEAAVKEAEVLVRALDRAIEVIEFCYMDQRDIKEITEPRKALRKYLGDEK